MKITKRQLRRIIKEEKVKLLSEIDNVTFDFPHMQRDAYAAVSSLYKTHKPMMVDYLREDEWANFERLVLNALEELKSEKVKEFSGKIVK
tara:strand:+ start:172 stop:441 length:270 start_codon:yes stop_codon:yes gene_type:complete